MKAAQKIAIKYLKKLTLFLQKRLNKNTLVNTSPIHSLAPKVLTDEKDLKTIQPYLDSLEQAINGKEINNIAITGGYGSGKSTILKTFQHLHPTNKYLNISLASFKDNKKEPEDSEFERRLEISILQQMFYHVEPSIIPDSRFKRIVTLSRGKLTFITLCIIVWILSTLVLFKFGYIDRLDPGVWKSNSFFDRIVTGVSSFIFFACIGLFIKNLYQLFNNSKINKLNIKGEVELGGDTEKSIFNKYLEEILYFFERTKFNVLVIEDIDRFESTDIFTKLREINILINSSNLIKQPVKFVYAIKDEMFKDKNERVKFFEFIIPVIPFINPSNANDQLTKLIANAKLETVLSADFTSDVVTFIDDIDMRLLINIFNEYQLCKNILASELKQDNLFAIIVYKNLYPDDFGDLQKKRGNLYKFFSDKLTYITNIIEQYKAQIQEIDQKIDLIENEMDKPIKELRVVYIYKLVSKLDKFHTFHIDRKNISLDEVLEDDNFEKLKTAPCVSYNRYYAGHNGGHGGYNPGIPLPFSTIRSEITFPEIEKEVSNELTYSQREKLLIDKTNDQINMLKLEKEEINKKISEAESMSIQEIFEVVDAEKHLGHFKESNLMRNLLLNGYIDEHYGDYISLFHEVNLTKEDFTFETKVKSGQNLAFGHTITKVENLLRRLPDKYFKKEVILNYKILAYLLDNKTKYEKKLKNFFTNLHIDGKKQFDFINGFIKNVPERIAPFIKELCVYKPTLWQYIHDKSDLPSNEIKFLLKHIFNYGDINSILKFSSLKSLESFIAKMDDFFFFCSLLEQTDTIQSFLLERRFLLEKLDSPNEDQKQLFEVIYTKNLYQLNQHNIISIIKGNSQTVDENKLNTSHYSTLLKSGLKYLLSYIEENIEDYIEKVMLLLKSNTEEDEKTIVDILNKNDVSIDLKTQIVRSQKAKVNFLYSIDDVEVKQILLKNNKLTVNWENIFDYYVATENKDFDDVLIHFLNREENYLILAKQKLNIIETEEDHIKNLSETLLQCEALEIRAYTNLVGSLPYTWNFVNAETLNIEKIEALLSKKILNLTFENFNTLKLKGNSLHIKLIEENQDRFVTKMNELSLDAHDWLLILKSDLITMPNKLSIIESIDNTIIVNNKDIAGAVCDILPDEQYIPMSYEVLNAIFDVPNSLSKKIAFLNLNFEKLDNSQIRVLIEKLGENYSKIFMKQHKPIFTNDTQHIALFEKLQIRNLIIKFEAVEKKNKIKVFAKYQGTKFTEEAVE